jgi:hypothetical protein
VDQRRPPLPSRGPESKEITPTQKIRRWIVEQGFAAETEHDVCGAIFLT